MVAAGPAGEAASRRVADNAEAKRLADPDAAALADRMRQKLAAKQAKETAAQRDESAEDRLLDSALEAKAQLLELSDFQDENKYGIDNQTGYFVRLTQPRVGFVP